MADPYVPTQEVERLTAEAWAQATSVMQQVDGLLSDKSKYVYGDDGRQLLRASAVLSLRTTDVAQLILTYGVRQVADAFRAVFGRPILEEEQISSFADPSAEGDWAGFYQWTQNLWTVIGQEQQFADVKVLTSNVFDHNKGYNRAINYAQQPALAQLVAAPPLSQTLAQQPVDGTAQSRALALYKAFAASRLIDDSAAVPWTAFATVIANNWTVISSQLGQADQNTLTDEVKAQLAEMYLISE